MTETIITVQGAHSATYPPDTATLALTVGYDGAERTAVFDLATRTAEDLRGRLTALHHDTLGPVQKWSSNSVSVWGDRPWNSDGKRLPIVYHSVINFTATFSDFDALARFIEESAQTEGISIGRLAWELTHENLLTATADARAHAVDDAVSKATAYAKAVGLGSVTAVALADPGMLGDQSNASGGGYQLASARGFMQAGGAPELSLKPEDIEVSAVVDARFIASAG